ncbi:MAG: hypothetical protein ABIG69_19640 [Bacteroidota bacterium]
MKKKVKQTVKLESPFNNYWDKTNYIILFAGLLTLMVGFYLMTFGPWDNPLSLTASPLVLLVAYIVLFPLAIFYRRQTSKVELENSDDPSES